MERDRRIRVSINGKFLLAVTEGMPRVALQVVLAMERVLSQDGNLARKFDIELVHPPAAEPPALEKIPVRSAGRRQGRQIWEQIDFPLATRGRTGVNFLSTGPLFKRNCLTVIHDAQMFLTPESFALKQLVMYRTVTPLIGHIHRRIVTVSEFSKSQLLRFGMCGSGVRVIHNAADHMLRFARDPAILDRLGIEKGSYILSNAYVHTHKNVRVLFRALELMDGSRAKLVLFGGSGRTAYEERGIRVPDRVVFAGRVTDEELRSLIEGAAVFAFPSTTEGFGFPPLEAMVLGCPAAVSRAGAMPEVCGAGAVYVDPHDAPGWAAVLQSFLSDAGLRAEMQAKAQARAGEFSWAATARQYLEVLEDMARDRIEDLSSNAARPLVTGGI